MTACSADTIVDLIHHPIFSTTGRERPTSKKTNLNHHFKCRPADIFLEFILHLHLNSYFNGGDAEIFKLIFRSFMSEP